MLVIGGAGYIGSVLVPKLLARGDDITVVDALMYGDDGLRQVYGHPQLTVIQGDLRDADTMAAAMEGAQAVVHLGGLVGDQACDLDPELTAEVNLTATRTIAEAASLAGVSRFVFASTCSVYGASSELLDESSPLQPLTTYARTKAESEALLAEMRVPGFTTVSLRFGTLYGLAPRLRFDLMVNLLTAKAVCEGGITIFGGSQWRPFVHVDDAAEATLRAMDAPAAVVEGDVFNVGSDEQNHPIADVGGLIQHVVPEAEVVYDIDRPGGADYCVSFAKIRAALGFTPRWSLLDGIRETKLALEQGVVTDYRDNRYSNEAALTERVEMLRASLRRPPTMTAGDVAH